MGKQREPWSRAKSSRLDSSEKSPSSVQDVLVPICTSTGSASQDVVSSLHTGALLSSTSSQQTSLDTIMLKAALNSFLTSVVFCCRWESLISFIYTVYRHTHSRSQLIIYKQAQRRVHGRLLRLWIYGSYVTQWEAWPYQQTSQKNFIWGCKDKCNLSYPNDVHRSTYASIEVDVCIKACGANQRSCVYHLWLGILRF